MPTFKTDHAEIYYESYGSGPLLIFAHGGGGNTFSWWQQAPYFAKSHRVILFDQRGFGRSQCEEGYLHPKYFPRDLLALYHAAGIDKATLVCQSLGGLTGLPFTIAHPERVKALILCGTTGGLRIPKELRGGSLSREEMKKRGPGRTVFAEDFPERKPELALLFSMITQLNDMTSMETLRPGMAETRVSLESLGGYNTPTLIIHGTNDALFRPEAMRAIADMIPGAVSVEIPAVGHSTYFEDAEAFNKAVDGFINDHE